MRRPPQELRMGPIELKWHKFLIVDDEPAIRRLLRLNDLAGIGVIRTANIVD